MARGKWNNGLKPVPPSRKGSKLSPEHQEALRKALKGNTWNRGRKHSAESTQLKRANSARYWLGITGKNHSAWKNSKVSPLYLSIRQCFQYRQWRWDVYTRDNFTCVLCGRSKEVSGQLEADHFPKMFIEILNEHQFKTLEEAIACEELWNINNGRTLCTRCHIATRRRPRKVKTP